jgi:hypothetical protein
VNTGPVEIDFPNGGQIVPIAAGFPILLEGMVGTINAYRKREESTL